MYQVLALGNNRKGKNMFTCEMSHCDDMISHEVVLTGETLEVCSECAAEWESEPNVLSVTKFAGIK